MGTLHLVATPIGNLEDITLRAIRVLREAVLIAAEDTRTTRVLLDRLGIRTPTTSYHERNKLSKIDDILAALDQGDVALVSDAGTPGINDPGYELVREVISRGHAVSPVPGPCAAIAALAASGLPTDQFVFEGFAPRKPGALAAWARSLAAERRTTIVYESPHRVAETVGALAAEYPDRPLCMAREITKLHETFWRGTCGEAAAALQTSAPRGEYVLVIGGAPERAEPLWEPARVEQALREALAAGLSGRDACVEVAAQAGWNRRDVVRMLDGVK